MNVFFVLGDEVVTPALQGSILSGITRMSVIDLLRSKGYKVTERRLSIDEVADAYKSGKLTEAFGSGTAAVISPIGQLKWGDNVKIINNNQIGKLSQYFKTLLQEFVGQTSRHIWFVVPEDGCFCKN
jgi:branched-chain amino acid aminotransferase